jgi:CRISPR-associated endonuclease Cas2
MVHFVASFDIPDDRRRRALALVLEAAATRVQLSVFEGDVGDATLRRVVRASASIVEIESGVS